MRNFLLLFLVLFSQAASAFSIDAACKYAVVNESAHVISERKLTIQEYTPGESSGVVNFRRIFRGKDYPFSGELEVVGRYSLYNFAINPQPEIHGEILVQYVEKSFWGYQTRIYDVKNFNINVAQPTQAEISFSSDKGDIKKFIINCDFKPLIQN